MNKAQNFVIWLDGFLDAVGDEINISKTNIIRNKLNNVFEHVAEPVEDKGKTLEQLGVEHGFPVHQGFPNSIQIGGVDSDGNIMRC